MAVALLLGFFSIDAQAQTAPAHCPPAGYDIAALRELRQQRFAIADAGRRHQLARALTACLSSPDSELRDQIGYEAFAYWRAAGALDGTTWRAIGDELQRTLTGRADAAGVAQPFAALVLAELVHADRDRPFLDAAQRTSLLDAAIGYFTAIRDYRGFDDDVGWRHGVAHAADLLGELARERDFGRPELDRILAALTTQIVARDRVYVFGESERIAAAAACVVSRSLHSNDEWKSWLATATSPAPLTRWSQAYQSRDGLIRRQNTMNFLLALYAELAQAGDAASRPFAGEVAAAMRPLR